jgi:preprotein translocase subunit YajC
MRVFFFQITQLANPKMSSLISLSEIVAQTTAPAGQPQGGMPAMMIVGYVLLFAAMYFFMIAPQRKKQKEHEKMLKALQSGDEIVTTGGIYGTITNVKEDRFVVRIADNTKIEVGKGFVSAVLNRQSAATTEKK